MYRSIEQKRTSTSSGKLINQNQFGAIRGAKNGHKDYLKNMLVNRLLKKFPGSGACQQIVEAEVQTFCETEFVSKDGMKRLEQ